MLALDFGVSCRPPRFVRPDISSRLFAG